MVKRTLDLATLYFLERCPTADIDTDMFKSIVGKTNATTIAAVLAQIPASHKSKIKILKQRLIQLEEKEMAKPKEPRAHDEIADASKEIYALARADAETQLAAMRDEIDSVRVESQAAGALQAIETNIAFQEFLKAITLQRIKQSKEYKKGGMTWDEFCDSLGLARRSVDLMLEDIRPIIDTFSAKIADFSGMPFSKIRLLGKQISANLAEIENGCLIYGDESIPLTPEHREDIQALIERIGDESREKVETLEAMVSAKDKVLKSKGDVINKMERSLKKFEKDAALKGLSVDEDAYLQQIENLKIGFDGYLLRLENYTTTDEFETPTPRMNAALISAAHYMRMQILALYDTVTATHGNPAMNPEFLADFERWESENQI